MLTHILFALLTAVGCAGEPEVDHDFPVTKTDAEWRVQLTDEQYRILRQAGTERAFTGKNWDNKAEGVYVCAACGHVLFASETKFESGTGWPSYYAPATEGAVLTASDRKFGMLRTEVLCASCGGHLGHVFPDGPPPTGQRYCINGNAMDFLPKNPPPAP